MPATAGTGASLDGDPHLVWLAIPPGGEEAYHSFYMDVLGMAKVDKPPMRSTGGLWIRAGRVELHPGVEEDLRPARKAHPGILVQDLDEGARRPQERGLEASWDERLSGYRRFYAHDPIENRPGFLAPVTPDGEVR